MRMRIFTLTALITLIIAINAEARMYNATVV